jgi:hypothetical protein
MKDDRMLLVVGSLRDDAARRVREAAATVGLTTKLFERPLDASSWLESHEPLAILVRPNAPGAAGACVRARASARLARVPIFGLVQETTDLSFEELFSWGGDDLVPLATSRPLVRRLRCLLTRKADTTSRRASSGYAIVAGADAGWRTIMARALFQGGFAVRFVSSAAGAAEESRAEGARLVVVAETSSDDPVPSLTRARESGSKVPWVIVAPPKRILSLRLAVATLASVAVTDAYAPPENALFVANELANAQGNDDKRASSRILYGTTVSFRAAGRDDDEIGFTYNISAGGVYIRTLAPLERGDEVWLDLWPPRSERRVRLAGKVAWRRLFGPDDSATVPPGFGVQLTDGLAGDLDRFRAGYGAFADTILGVS